MVCTLWGGCGGNMVVNVCGITIPNSRETKIFIFFTKSTTQKGMHTITLQINNNNALKTIQNLKDKHFISIIENSNLHSPSLSGTPMSLNEFKNWIKDAGQTSTVSLNEAKGKWAHKRKQLQKLIK